MDYLTIDDLKQLSGRYSAWCVSVFMPTIRAGDDTRQNPIRFKNLISEVEKRLAQKGLRSPDIRKILAPTEPLLLDSIFWQFQSDGLAIYLSEEGIKTFRLPIRFDELVVISDRFHLKPLLPFFAHDGHFYILTLDQKQVQLFEGTRHTVDEIQLENMPASMSEALQYERFEKSLQFHTGTGAATARGDRAAVFHGHDPSDEDKNRLLRWFHKVDDELNTFLAGQQAPLVLAGVEYYFPLFRQASDYPNILAQGVTGSPDPLRPEELHAKAWALVEPIFTQDEKNALDRFHQLTAQNKTTAGVEEAVQAAYFGQVDTLFVTFEMQIWGKVDPEKHSVEVHDDQQSGDEDLLDLAAVHTLANRGEVYVLPRERMPGGELIAAILRY